MDLTFPPLTTIPLRSSVISAFSIGMLDHQRVDDFPTAVNFNMNPKTWIVNMMFLLDIKSLEVHLKLQGCVTQVNYPANHVGLQMVQEAILW